MLNFYSKSEDLSHSSAYWNWLNTRNTKQIMESGYESFKQTVARNYFTWVGDLDGGFAKNLLTDPSLLKDPVDLKILLTAHEHFTVEESMQCNLVTLLLERFVRSRIAARSIEIYPEPKIGNPPCITINGKDISQDNLNSLLELCSIDDGIKIQDIRSVVEIGPGSGRTAYAFLKSAPQLTQYVLVDTPPALYVSQRYLSALFPDEKIFKFRPFSSWDEVKPEFLQSRIVFMMPHQFELIRHLVHYDLFLAIDCLHEMRPERIRHYFETASDTARNVYFKCWNKTKIPFDRIVLDRDSYPVPQNWQKIYLRDCIVPSDFFETFYCIPNASPIKNPTPEFVPPTR